MRDANKFFDGHIFRSAKNQAFRDCNSIIIVILLYCYYYILNSSFNICIETSDKLLGLGIRAL